jgi:hypothetical protein
MEIVIFVSLVALVVIGLIWANSRSEKRPDAAQQRREQLRKARKELLETPANYTLSRPDQVWHTRRHGATMGVTRTNAFVARSLGQDPEYDGYSRRDRHHLHDHHAHIKTEAHAAEEPRMGSVEYKESGAAG